jgi:3-hydroxybutyryl-CoA dehydrogenase
MNLVVIGNDAALNECKARLGPEHHYLPGTSVRDKQDLLAKADAVFDFSDTYNPESIQVYAGLDETPVFLNTVYTTISSVLASVKTVVPIYGFCGLPTFFNREILEVALAPSSDAMKLKSICEWLNLKYIAVKDQVGFVAPRVVCMIINEAFEALQQGVASKADIDLSMKLGTNYPFGPFEWSERIGLGNVKRLLTSIEQATGDARYRSNI